MDTKELTRRRTKYSLITSRHFLEKKCEICSADSHTHHICYKTPFLIIFLCEKHHIKLHQLIRGENYEKTLINFSKRYNLTQEVLSEILYCLLFDPRFATSINHKNRFADVVKHFRNVWKIELNKRSIKYLFDYYYNLKIYLLLRLKNEFIGSYADFYRHKI